VYRQIAKLLAATLSALSESAETAERAKHNNMWPSKIIAALKNHLEQLRTSLAATLLRAQKKCRKCRKIQASELF
jgi:hypothetical protein